jgi:hypothetical protein
MTAPWPRRSAGRMGLKHELGSTRECRHTRQSPLGEAASSQRWCWRNTMFELRDRKDRAR